MVYSPGLDPLEFPLCFFVQSTTAPGSLSIEGDFAGWPGTGEVDVNGNSVIYSSRSDSSLDLQSSLLDAIPSGSAIVLAGGPGLGDIVDPQMGGTLSSVIGF
jgi:hypothetical protein